MSRARKTFARKQAKQEDREDAAFINERLKELGPDPDKWETVKIETILQSLREAEAETERLNEIRKVDPESLNRPFTI